MPWGGGGGGGGAAGTPLLRPGDLPRAGDLRPGDLPRPGDFRGDLLVGEGVFSLQRRMARRRENRVRPLFSEWRIDLNLIEIGVD